MATDSIGIKYYVDLTSLSATIRQAKGLLNSFHKEIESLSKKSSVKISVDKPSIDKAKGQIEKTAKDLQTSLNKTGKIDLKDIESKLADLGITSETSATQMKQLGLSTANYQKIATLTKVQLKDLNDRILKNGSATAEQSHQYNRLTKRLEVANTAIRQQKGALGDAARAADRWSAAGMKAMMVSQTAWMASGAAIFAVIGTIAQGFRDIVSYHQSLKDLEAITEGNADEMKIMSNAIRDASVATKFFAADMAKAATLMAQAGLTAQEVADSIGAIAILASATGKPLEEVADLMSTILKAFELNAKEALRAANVLAAGISKSKLQIDKIRTAMNYMGVAAHQFNISLESTVAWLGILSDRGLKASTIGTSFRGVLAALTKETDNFSRVLAKLDKPLGFADITIRGGRKLEDSLKRVKESGFSVTDAFEGLNRRVAMTFSLMVENVDKFEDLREAITGTNRAIEMNKTSMEGLGSQFKQMKSILDEVFIAFTKEGEALTGFAKAIKVVLQIVGLSIVTISTFFDMIMKGVAVTGALGTINWKRLLVGDLEGATREARGIWKEYKKDIEKEFEDYLDYGERIIGKGIGGYITSKEEERIKKVEETIVSLTKKKEELVKKMKEVGEASEEYRKIQGEVYKLTAQIDELEKSIGLLDDTIAGPILDLKTAMLDLAVSGKMSAEDLIGVFRKGEDDIDLLTKATQKLEEEFLKAFEEWKTVGSKNTEEYNRMITLAERLSEARKKVLAIEQSITKEKERQRDAEEAAIKNYIKTVEDIFKEIIGHEKKYEDIEFEQHKRAMKYILTEAEYRKWVAAEELKREKELLQQKIDALEDYRIEAKASLQKLYEESPVPFAEEELTEWLNEIDKLIDAIIEKFKKLKDKETFEPYDKEDMWGGLKKGADEWFDAVSNKFEMMRNLAKDAFSDISNTWSDLVYDSMIGELKSINDYWKVLKNAILRHIADIAVKMAMSGIAQKVGKVDWLNIAEKVAGAVTTIFGAGGGASTTAAPAVTYAHTGGDISNIGSRKYSNTPFDMANAIRMHSGGEVPIIGKTGEYMMRDKAVDSLGKDRLDYMNSTGKFPESQPKVIDRRTYNTFINAIDAATFEQTLREKGGRAIYDMSLNSLSMGRQKRDPRAISR